MKIAIVHPNLNLKGGAEYVSLQFLEALNKEHDLELITLKEPELEELNEFYELKVEDLEVRVPSLPYSIFSNTSENFNKMRNSAIKKYAMKHKGKYDLLISTHNEAGFGEKGLQYIHFPERINEAKMREEEVFSTDLSGNTGPIHRVYNTLLETFFLPETEAIKNTPALCNSEFTKEAFQHAYNTEAEVLNPPVSIEFEEETNFEERKNGFVSIGRICPPKSQKKAIKIIDQLQEDHNVHLHIIGRSETEYAEEVREMSKEREYIHFEGEMERNEMKNMIQEHKFGIHNLKGEHYGITVAEMIKGGCIVFAPDFGNPGRMLPDELTFSSEKDAVKKTSDILQDKESQQKVLETLEDIEFMDPEKFQERIREKVSEIAED